MRDGCAVSGLHSLRSPPDGCALSGLLSLRSSLDGCALSGLHSLRSSLDGCALSGLHSLRSFLDGCALSGLHSLRSFLDGCALSGLHSLRSSQHSISYIPPLPPNAVKEDVTTALAQRLIASIPLDRSNNFERWRVRELLAWLVEFYRRENRPVWWAMFDRHEMTEDELYDDADCLARLVRTNRPAEPIKKSRLFEYEFDPDQDTKFHEGSKCYFAHDLKIHATVEHFDG